MVSDTYLPQVNGVATSIYLFKKYLEMRGDSVYVVAPVKPDEDPTVLKLAGITFPMEKQHKLVFAQHLKIIEFAEKNGIELVHSHDPLALGIRALKVQKALGIPHIHTYHTLLTEYRHYVPPPFRPDKKTIEEFSKWFCNKVNTVIAPTQEIKDELINYGVERPIYILPTGIDTLEFSKPAEVDIRKIYNIPEDAFLFLYAGRLAKEKNLTFLSKVVAKYIKSRNDTWFLIVGDGPEKRSLISYFEDEGIIERCVFTGYVPHSQIKDYYKASNLFVFASVTETQGLVVLESLAAGTPVVAIAQKGIANVLADGEGSYTVPEENEKEFFDAIVRAVDSVEELKVKAPLYVETNWSMNKMVDRIIEIYDITKKEGYFDIEIPSVFNTSILMKLNTLFRKLSEW